MRFVHPWLLLTAIPLLAIGIWLTINQPLGGTRRDRIAGVLRALSLVLLVLALAQPQIGHGSDRPTLLLLDRSASIDAPASKQQTAWLRAARDSNHARRYGVVQFAGTPALTPAAGPLLPQTGPHALDPGATDLGSAVRLALARVPRGGRLVVATDGFATGGAGETGAAGGTGGTSGTGGADATADLDDLAALARSRGVTIDAARLADTRRDAGIPQLQAPPSLHAGDPLPLAVTVRSTARGTAQLSLQRGGRPIGHEGVVLRPGATPLLLSLTAPRTPGTYGYGVNVTLPGDRIPQNDQLDAAVRVTREPRVVVASSTTSRLPAMLEANGIDVTQTTPQSLPDTPDGYANADAVVLDDVSAPDLGSTRAQAITQAVRSTGLGLVVTGGEHSFSLGRYAGSTIDDALPVASLRPGNRQQRDLALEVVLDRSGSMADTAGPNSPPKIQMAQAAARVAARFAARHRDDLGIVSFDITPHTLTPLAPIVPGPAVTALNRKIDGLQADGGTDIYLALQSAAQQIETNTRPQRHVILMSDGVSEVHDYTTLLAQLARDRITVSTVALGSEADVQLLRSIATRTHGSFYEVSDASRLPSIFARDVRRTARPTRLHGHIAVSPGADSPVVRSLANQSLPPLRGNIVTTLRPGAQADLLGRDTGHAPDPVLAQWQYGAGRVVTWTPGLDPATAGAWADNATLWQDATRWAERPAATPALTPALTGGSLVVDPVANGAAPLDLATLAGSLTGPGGQTTNLRFTQSAASTYTAPLPAGLPAGVYQTTVSASGGTGAGATSSATGGVAVPYPAEYTPRAANGSPLGPLVAATGGRLFGVHDTSAIESTWTSIWWWLALAALVAFLGGAAVRLLGGTRR